MFLSSTDDNVAMIDEQLRLLDAAKEELSTAAQPQFTYSTTLDNFLARIENKFYIDSLDVGDFIYLSIRDDYAVKLRVISMQYNPCAMNNDLSITFSNMISSKSKRDDFSYLLNSSSNHSKNSYNSSSSNNSTKNDGPQITTGLLTKLLNSGAFSNKVNQISNDNINQTVGGLLALKDLNSEMIKATDIEGKNGFFEYIQSKLISADKIVADSAELKKLSAFVASIDNLIAGKISADDLHAIHLTAKNVAIDEAVISEVIAARIQVGMLAAGTINTDKFTISSKDGGGTTDTTFQISAVDTRGEESPKSNAKDIYIFAYGKPQITNIKVNRKNNFEKETTISCNAGYKRLNNLNTVTLKATCSALWTGEKTITTSIDKESDDNTGYKSVEFQKIFSDSSYSDTSLYTKPGFDIEKSFNVTLTLTDRVGVAVATIGFVPQGVPLFTQTETGINAIGMIPKWDSPCKLQVNSDILAKDSDGNEIEIINAIKNLIKLTTDGNEPTQATGSYWIKATEVTNTIT